MESALTTLVFISLSAIASAALAQSLPSAATAPTAPVDMSASPAALSVAFNIPAQPLSAALAELAQQANVELALPPRLADGKNAVALTGQKTIAAALAELLMGSGLDGRLSGNVLLIEVAGPSPSAAASEPPASADSGNAPRTLNTVTVSAVREKATATKQDAELRDLPQSVVIVGEQSIQERAYTRIEDVANRVVNLQAVAPYTGGVSLGFFSRGFNGTASQVDGYNAGLVSGSQSNIFDLISFDQVEVLRGPASVLYGQGNPGGVVNLILKRPLRESGLSTNLLVESTGTRRTELDWNTPLADTLALRTVAALEDSTTFRDFGVSKRTYISPALRWQPTASTTVDAVYAYGKYQFNNDRNFSAIRELVRDMPVERNLTEPWLPLNRIDVESLRLEAARKLSDRWTLTAGYFENRNVTKSGFELAPIDLIEGTTQVSRYYSDYPDPDKNRSRDRTLSLRLRGEFDALGMRHKLLAGVERARSFYVYEALEGEVGPIDYLNPVYETVPLPRPDTFSFAGGGGNAATSFYVNDLIAVAPQLKLQLGLRHDKIVSEGYSDAVFTLSNSATYKKTSPSVGVVWQPNDAASLYANYATSYLPQFGRNRFGNILDPEIGRSVELGLKQEVLDGKLALTAAVFNIEKSNILQIDPSDNNFLVSGGKARSKGFELELQGRPMRGTDIALGLGYADARWTESNDFPVGGRLVGASPLTAVLSVRQALSADWAPPGAWVSGAVNYGSKREWLPTIDEYKLPAYTRVDLAAGIPLGNFELQFNIKNLLDERIALSNGFGLVAPDTPRTFGVLLRWRTGSL